MTRLAEVAPDRHRAAAAADSIAAALPGASYAKLDPDSGDYGVTPLDFAPTPIMSTYLLAFVVGELEVTEPVDVDGVPIRIVHRPGRGDAVDFATDAAVFCLRWLTEYFGVPYYGDKLDLLAIPDFAFGAMENTGCVTFREVLLLVDPETTTQPEQQQCVHDCNVDLAKEIDSTNNRDSL